jgi:N-acetyl-anhydromuramyl-L-alanine amidase AmpD
MTFADDLRAALKERFGAGWVNYMPRWSVARSTGWRGGGKPKAIVLHHTAAAATSSVNPAHSGNQKGANQNVINYIQTHYTVPAANFTLDRDGSVYVHCAYPIWHAGLGSFVGKPPWSTLGIPNNLGNNYMLGVEIMSKGLIKDFTEAQKDSLYYLMQACRDASGWRNMSPLYRPRHRDWTSRKIDPVYTNTEIGSWLS